VFGWVLAVSAGSQLHISLDTNIQSFELLPDDSLRLTPTQNLQQKSNTAVLRENEGVEVHTSPIEGRQVIDNGSESVGG
jgi:hypothetical protein